jgi:ABC-2 type transport system ATP-binding protein
MSEIVIRAQALSRHFGDVKAVDSVSFEVAKGEIFGFLGHNGAGKTTTVRLLNGILAPTAGQARVLDLDPIADGPALRRRTGVLTETPSLDDRLTARDTLRIYADIYGVPRERAAQRVDELLQAFELADRADARVGGYSKGMRQRMALARTLLHDPEILFLDEPTTGLDPEARVDMWSEIARLSGEEGLTILMTTHYLEEADRLARRLAIVDHGRIVAEGSPEELKGELRGDAIVVELEQPPRDGEVTAALAGVPGLHDIVVDASTLRARTESGARMVPALLGALEGAGVGVAAVTVARPSLDDVYLRHAGKAFCEDDAEVKR